MAKGFALAQDLTGDVIFWKYSAIDGSIQFEVHPASRVKIPIDVSWFECVCPCFGETTNYYRMTSSDPMGISELQEVGIIQENSECCARFCCQQWRPWKQMFLDTKNEILFESKSTFGCIYVVGKYKIPAAFCCPCSRPEIDVEYKDKKIGEVKQPYMFCGRSP